MKKRQLKKILDLYVLDAGDDILIPPSVYRPEEREMEKYFSKAWRISNPEEAKKFFEALEKARAEAEAEYNNGCCCGGNCEGDCKGDCKGDEGCDCNGEGCKCKKN